MSPTMPPPRTDAGCHVKRNARRWCSGRSGGGNERRDRDSRTAPWGGAPFEAGPAQYWSALMISRRVPDPRVGSVWLHSISDENWMKQAQDLCMLVSRHGRVTARTAAGKTLSVSPRPDAGATGSGRTQHGYGFGLSLVRESGPIWYRLDTRVVTPPRFPKSRLSVEIRSTSLLRCEGGVLMCPIGCARIVELEICPVLIRLM